ncbi:MAG: putative DNA binding domain-containing protein [Flavobacteriales bacterium]|nr:putative DNA binding domain-containing protein [Flavobacteriales bacterium]
MALPVNIDDLLHGRSVEWERMEFKQGWNPEAVLRSICAFANDFHNLGGGYIFIGVGEQHGQPVIPPVGIAPASIDAIQKEILNFGYHAIVPQYHPIVVPHSVGDKTILVIWAPGGQQRPYKAKASLARDEQGYRYYIRQNSSTVVAQGDYETELLSLAAQIPFDDRMNQRATVEELDRDRMLTFLKEVGSELLNEASALSTLELAEQMRIVDGASEAVFPRNVGLLFFGKDPQHHFREARIEVAWFPDGPAGASFKEKVFVGPLDRMLREALDFIQRNYLHDVVTKHADRAQATRVVNYPYAAIEEALVNAVYHRSYEVREPIEVRITPEELTILSYPGPDRSINLEQLRAGRAVSRRYRNRRIGEFLKELDLTEGRATGIPKIIRAMRENGSPEPVFETEDERTTFLVRLPVHAESRAQDPTAQVTAQVEALRASVFGDLAAALRAPTAQVTAQAAAQVAAIMQAAAEGEQSSDALMAAASLSHREHFRKNYLTPLMMDGWLVRTLPQPNHPQQRYKITEKGRNWLDRFNVLPKA